LTERRGATGAEVIVDLLVRQNEQELFTDRHGFAALLTIERRGAEAFELLHVEIMESGFPLHDGSLSNSSAQKREINAVCPRLWALGKSMICFEILRFQETFRDQAILIVSLLLRVDSFILSFPNLPAH
jgi:hypothetical protein